MTTRFLGQLLLERAVISNEQLKAAVAVQERMADGRLAARARHFGVLSESEVARVQKRQEGANRSFVDIAKEEGLLTAERIELLAAELLDDQVTLGDALLQTGAMSAGDLSSFLEECRRDVYAGAASLEKLLGNSSNARVLGVVVNQLTLALTRTLRDIITAKDCHGSLDRVIPCEYTICQALRGDFSGELYLNLSGASLLRIASGLMDEQAESFSNTVADGAGEFLNIASGNACVELSAVGTRVEPEPPRCFRHRIGAPDWNQRFATLFDFRAHVGEPKLTVVTLDSPEDDLELCIVERSPTGS